MWLAGVVAGSFWAGILLLGGRVGSREAVALVLGGLIVGLALGMARRGAEPSDAVLPALAGPGAAGPSERERVLRAAGFLPRDPRAGSKGGGVHPALRAVALAAALAAIGGGWGALRARDPPELDGLSGRRVRFLATAVSDVRPNDTGWGLEARIGEIEGRPDVPSYRVWLSGRGEVSAVEAGQPLSAEGMLGPVEPGDSGFDDYLARRGVVATVSVSEIEALGPPTNPALRLANAARRVLIRGSQDALADRDAGLLLGLTIGDTTRMDPEVEEDFRATGLGHLVAVSGSNVAMVLVPVLGLAALARARPGVRFAGGVAAVVLFALITRWEPSVLRASVMASLAMLGILAGRPRDTATLLSAATLLLLVGDPRLAHSLAFQLSVAATAGIVLLAGWLAERLAWLPRPVALAAAATVGAQVAVTPLLLLSFGVVPLVTLPANLLAFPAVAPAFLGGTAAAVTAEVWEPLGRALGALATLPLAYLAWVADRMARLPLPSLVGLDWVLPTLLAVSIGLAGLAVARFRRPGRLVLLTGALVIVWTLIVGGGGPAELTVIFLDVGQGDAAVLRTPEGATVLIDAGPEERLVATKLAGLGLGAIDLAVATHAHADHVEGFPAVLARHDVGLLLDPGCPADSPSYARFLEAAEAEGVFVRHPRGGDRLRVGGLLIEVLGPDECAVDSPNDDSIVLRLTYEGATVLFPGDAEAPTQQDMLDDGDPVTALVLKVPHHGGATSDEAFFRAVGARLAVVSVGPNEYGHPTREALEALRATGAKVLRTDLEGDVTVMIGAGRVLVESAM